MTSSLLEGSQIPHTLWQRHEATAAYDNLRAARNRAALRCDVGEHGAPGIKDLKRVARLHKGRSIWSEREGLSAVPRHRRRNAGQIETTRVNACLDGAMPPKTEPRLTEIKVRATMQPPDLQLNLGQVFHLFNSHIWSTGQECARAPPESPSTDHVSSTCAK